MATKATIDRLSQRIEQLAATAAPELRRPVEAWIVNGDKAYLQDDPSHVLTVAEMKAREVNADLVVMTIVDAVNGRPA